MANNNNPWLGPGTYEEENAYKFRGRDKDIAKIKLMLQQNDIVVCYGASGNGKSSLIKAGVSPAIRNEGMFPVVITFTEDDYKKDHIDFETLILERVENSLQDYEEFMRKHYDLRESSHLRFERDIQYRDKQLPLSLWWKLRTETIRIPYGGRNFIPVLIFDQFEEIFYSAWKDEFFKWLESLCKDVCPDDFSVIGKDINPPSYKQFKVLVSLRYEYLAELDDWCSQRTFIPQIMQNRYYLRPLSREQAIEVITKQPLRENSPEYCTTLNPVKNAILDFIDIEKRNEIEPVILSVLCYTLCNIALNNRKDEISVRDLQDFSLGNIISGFYETEVKRIILNKRHQEFLEQKLVNAEGRRERIQSERLKPIDFDKKYRKALEDTHLIRISQINKEDYVELVHDRVADAIIERRQEASKRKRILWSRIGLLLTFLIVFCFTYWNQLWTSNKEKARNFPYMEYRDKQQIDTVQGYYIKIVNKWPLQTIICKSTYSNMPITISNCPELETIDASSFENNELNLDISNCVNFKHLIINSSLKSLSLKINGCPSIRQIELPNNLSKLTIESLQDNISFKIGRNTHYHWEKGVLWDIDNDTILYARSDASREVIAFSNSKKDKYIYSLAKEFTVKGRQKANVMIYDSLHKIRFIPVSYREDSVDLSQNHIVDADGDSVDLSQNFKSITVISGAFRNNLNLFSIKFPSANELKVENLAFAGCKNLKHIEFDSLSRVNIESNTFEECDCLKVIHFPQKVELDKNSIYNCSSLEKVVFGREASLPAFSFHSCPSLREVFLPQKISKESQPSCFLGCPNVKFHYDPSFWEEMEDGTIIYKENPDFVLANNVKYHTFSNDKYYSKEGVLYNQNGIYNIPLNIAQNNEDIRQNGNWSYNIGNEPEIFIKPNKYKSRDGVYIFPVFNTIPQNLKTFHIPWSNGVQLSSIDLSLTDSQKSNITLYVPSGCLKYFSDHPSYREFKDIKEESFFDTIWLIIEYHFNTGMSFVSNYQLWWLIIIAIVLLTIALGCFAYYKRKKDGERIKQKQKWEIALKSASAIFFGIFFWYVTYWFLFLSVMPWSHVNNIIVFEVISTFFACLIAVIAVYYILFSDGFSWKELKKTAKNNWKVIKQICVVAYENPKKTVKIVIIILIPFILFATLWLYRNYREEKLQVSAAEVEKAIEYASNYSDKALDVLYKAYKNNYSTIKGEPIEDMLFSAIYSKMITAGKLDGVDTLACTSANSLNPLPDGSLIYGDQNYYHLLSNSKDTIICPYDEKMKINANSSYMAVKDKNKCIVIIDMSTWEKDTLGYSGAFDLHPTQPILAYCNSGGIWFYNMKERKKMDTEVGILITDDNVNDICFNKKGDEIAIGNSNNYISIYHFDNDKWAKTQGDIWGVFPLYVTKDNFAAIRNDSLLIWSGSIISEGNEKKWYIESPYAEKSFSEDGKLAVTRYDKKIKLLDLTSPGKELLNLNIGYNLHASLISTDGKYIYMSFGGYLVKAPLLSHEQIYSLFMQMYSEQYKSSDK